MTEFVGLLPNLLKHIKGVAKETMQFHIAHTIQRVPLNNLA